MASGIQGQATDLVEEGFYGVRQGHEGKHPPDDPGGSLHPHLPVVLLRAIEASTAVQGMTIASNSSDFPLVYANEAFLLMTGYSAAEVLDRNCRFLQGRGTDPGSIAAMSQALSTGCDIRVVLKNYRCDGSEFWNEVSISPLRHPVTGNVTHFIGTQTERPGP